MSLYNLGLCSDATILASDSSRISSGIVGISALGIGSGNSIGGGGLGGGVFKSWSVSTASMTVDNGLDSNWFHEIYQKWGEIDFRDEILLLTPVFVGFTFVRDFGQGFVAIITNSQRFLGLGWQMMFFS